MTIQWNGYDVGMAPGMVPAAEAALGPLPYTYAVVSGRRTVAQQNGEYAKGRDANGNIINVDAVVTYASGTNSPHVWGLAFDFVPVVNGKALWEPISHPAWQAAFAAIDASPTLHSGRSFSNLGDYDHAERLNWRLYLPVGQAPDVTGTGAGGSAPTSDAGNGDGGSPAPDSSGGLNALASDALTWLELDPGVAIGAAALLGVLLLLWLQRRQ